IDGNATIDTAFGGVTLRNVSGFAKVKSNNGNITVTDITGTLTAESRFGAVRAERVRGATDVSTTNGNVTLNDVGAAKVKSSFGSVFVDGVGGPVEVWNANGAIALSGLRGSGCQPVSLRTNFSSIKVALPEGADYAVSARTSFGDVRSTLPVSTLGSAQGTLIGTIGRGGCKLELVNANGNITIEKD
ncbi:MAG: DUF4097 family beta strand repeat-containing protein, partial [Thermoanaerobaculia bacterium]